MKSAQKNNVNAKEFEVLKYVRSYSHTNTQTHARTRSLLHANTNIIVSDNEVSYFMDMSSKQSLHD